MKQLQEQVKLMVILSLLKDKGLVDDSDLKGLTTVDQLAGVLERSGIVLKKELDVASKIVAEVCRYMADQITLDQLQYRLNQFEGFQRLGDVLIGEVDKRKRQFSTERSNDVYCEGVDKSN